MKRLCNFNAQPLCKLNSNQQLISGLSVEFDVTMWAGNHNLSLALWHAQALTAPGHLK